MCMCRNFHGAALHARYYCHANQSLKKRSLLSLQRLALPCLAFNVTLETLNRLQIFCNGFMTACLLWQCLLMLQAHWAMIQ